MTNELRQLQKSYEELLEATKTEKTEIKKNIPKLSKLMEQNEALGLDTTPIQAKIVETEIMLDTYNIDIVKYKKIIHRLGVCINIMQGEQEQEIQSPTIEDEE